MSETENPNQYPDVLIRADRSELDHKRREKMEDPRGIECYWSVNGTPQRTGRGGAVLFHDGFEVWGIAIVLRVEEGKIWFKPIRDADGLRFDVPEPPTRGFAYVGEDT